MTELEKGRGYRDFKADMDPTIFFSIVEEIIETENSLDYIVVFEKFEIDLVNKSLRKFVSTILQYQLPGPGLICRIPRNIMLNLVESYCIEECVRY